MRPGFKSFGAGREELVLSSPAPNPLLGFEPHREMHFATDVGGVLEFYPTRRIVTRFDAGDSIIRYGDSTRAHYNGTTVQPDFVRGETRHNFQFSAGIGFRFYRAPSVGTNPLSDKKSREARDTFARLPRLSFNRLLLNSLSLNRPSLNQLFLRNAANFYSINFFLHDAA